MTDEATVEQASDPAKKQKRSRSPAKKKAKKAATKKSTNSAEKKRGRGATKPFPTASVENGAPPGDQGRTTSVLPFRPTPPDEHPPPTAKRSTSVPRSPPRCIAVPRMGE